METVYKCVVETYDDGYVSAICYRDNEYGKKYPIGEKVTADIGGLFVFKELDDAKEFGGIVLKCDTECVPEEIKFIRTIVCDKELIEEFWNTPKEERHLFSDKAPRGACIVDSLIPLEAVYKEPGL